MIKLVNRISNYFKNQLRLYKLHQQSYSILYNVTTDRILATVRNLLIENKSSALLVIEFNPGTKIVRRIKAKMRLVGIYVTVLEVLPFSIKFDIRIDQ